MDKKDRFEILLEHMNDKFDLMMEYVKLIPEIIQEQKRHAADISELKTDVKAIRVVVTDHSSDIAELKSRL